jgi:hypothetical protein
MKDYLFFSGNVMGVHNQKPSPRGLHEISEKYLAQVRRRPTCGIGLRAAKI